MKLSKDELEDVLEELEKHKGSATELISVYIPAGYDVNSVQRQLEAEKSTAKNIKSTGTRKNVGEALDKIVRFLKDFKKTPENGMAVFAGNVAEKEGQSDVQLWDIEPPQPLKIRIYRCDKEFVLEPLEEMIEIDEIFGLLVMDRKEATIGMLEGKRIEVLHKMTSGIPSKVRAGGQCLSPDTLVKTRKKIKMIKEIKRGDEIKAMDLESNKIVFTRVKNKWKVTKDKYIQINIDQLYFDFVASEEHTFFKRERGKIVEVLAKDLKKGDFLINTDDDDEIFDMRIKGVKIVNKIIEMIDIETESKNFFANWTLVHNSSQRFHRITEGLTRDFYKRIAEEMKKIFFENRKLKGILIGGPVPTKDEFVDGKHLTTQLQDKIIGMKDIGNTDESGLKDLVTASQDVLAEQEVIHEKKILEKFFETLGEKPDLATRGEKDTKHALNYGAVGTLLISKKIDKKIVRELIEIAKNTGAEVEIISTDNSEGEQFLNLSGIGGILRFRI